LEALARAGLHVGLNVSPVLPGLDERELDLGGLLTRASNAGARFAGMEMLKFGQGQKEAFLQAVTRAFPEAGARFRRIVGLRPLPARPPSRRRLASRRHRPLLRGMSPWRPGRPRGE